jgi:hypothetical protein
MKVHFHEDARAHLHPIKALPFELREVLISRNKQGTIKGLHMNEPLPQRVRQQRLHP